MSVKNCNICGGQSSPLRENFAAAGQPHDHAEVTESAVASSRLKRQAWLIRLAALRATLGTGKQGSSTETILDDLRSDHA